MPTLVKAAALSIQLTINEYERLLRRIERLEKHVLKRIEKPAAPKVDNRPFQQKEVENNTVLRIKKILKSNPKGINALTAPDYEFFRKNRHRFT